MLEGEANSVSLTPPPHALTSPPFLSARASHSSTPIKRNLQKEEPVLSPSEADTPASLPSHLPGTTALSQLASSAGHEPAREITMGFQSIPLTTRARRHTTLPRSLLPSLPPSSKSGPGSHSGSFSPLPTKVRAFNFFPRLIQHFLPSSTHVELCILAMVYSGEISGILLYVSSFR